MTYVTATRGSDDHLSTDSAPAGTDPSASALDSGGASGKSTYMGVARRAVLSAALAAVAASAGCGARKAPRPSPPDASAAPDLVLLAAADQVLPMLQSRYRDSYAGLVLDHPENRVTIYRRPDAGLDAAVRSRLPGVRVRFVDATYSLAWMRKLADRIVADKAYWAGRGVHVRTAAPLADGSGVRVATTEGTPAQATVLAQRYATTAISVRKAVTGLG
jgi:hypothetical protein